MQGRRRPARRQAPGGWAGGMSWRSLLVTLEGSDSPGSFDDLDAAGSGNDSNLGESDEQPVFDHARNGCEPANERLRLWNARERGVEDEVRPIRDKSMALAGPARDRWSRAAARGSRRLAGATGRRKPERHHLDRQRKAAKHGHELAVVGDDDHAGGSGGHDLLAQQGAATALDEGEVRRDLVGAVDGQVERGRLVE